jgi:hypothetical protein
MAKSGTLGRLTINRQDYPVMNDADVSRILGIWAKESIATTGDPVEKFTKQTETAEGFDVGLTGAQRENLREVINSKDPAPCSYESPAGDVYTCDGYVSATGDVTQDAKVTLKIDPSKAAGWTAITV